MRRPIATALLVIYLLILLDLTLLQFRQHDPLPNFRPFQTIARDRHLASEKFLFNFVGNLVAFVPFGFLLPTVWPSRYYVWRVLVSAAALSIAIEVAQYASGRRVADVDDVILNTTGALLGCGAFAGVRRWGGFTAERRREKE